MLRSNSGKDTFQFHQKGKYGKICQHTGISESVKKMHPVLRIHCYQYSGLLDDLSYIFLFLWKHVQLSMSKLLGGIFSRKNI